MFYTSVSNCSETTPGIHFQIPELT